jgi:hypothetical protein
MAVVILGGLITSTFLFIVSTLYLRVNSAAWRPVPAERPVSQ